MGYFTQNRQVTPSSSANYADAKPVRGSQQERVRGGRCGVGVVGYGECVVGSFFGVQYMAWRVLSLVLAFLTLTYVASVAFVIGFVGTVTVILGVDHPVIHLVFGVLKAFADVGVVYLSWSLGGRGVIPWVTASVSFVTLSVLHLVLWISPVYRRQVTRTVRSRAVASLVHWAASRITAYYLLRVGSLWSTVGGCVCLAVSAVAAHVFISLNGSRVNGFSGVSIAFCLFFLAEYSPSLSVFVVLLCLRYTKLGLAPRRRPLPRACYRGAGSRELSERFKSIARVMGLPSKGLHMRLPGGAMLSLGKVVQDPETLVGLEQVRRLALLGDREMTRAVASYALRQQWSVGFSSEVSTSALSNKAMARWFNDNLSELVPELADVSSSAKASFIEAIVGSVADEPTASPLIEGFVLALVREVGSEKCRECV